jgi:hypothetical protein
MLKAKQKIHIMTIRPFELECRSQKHKLKYLSLHNQLNYRLMALADQKDACRLAQTKPSATF